MLSLNSCNNLNSQNSKFIEIYENENFDSFVNKGILIRNFDKDNDPVIYVCTDLQNAFNNGPYIVVIDRKTERIKSSSTNLMSDSSNLDKLAMNKLALKFLKYKIRLLKVDRFKNVFINIFKSEEPTLVRFSNLKYKTGQYKTGWIKINKYWYEKDV